MDLKKLDIEEQQIGLQYIIKIKQGEILISPTSPKTTSEETVLGSCFGTLLKAA